MFLSPKKQSNTLTLLTLVSLLAVVFVAAMGYLFFRGKKIDQTDLVDEAPQGHNVVFDSKTLISIAPRFLGFSKPQTYLVLFLNNTELRPGGGFIGSYAVVTLDKGKATIHDVSGSENTRWKDKSISKPEPPSPLEMYLGVSEWYFRDANWSPDFQSGAKMALDLYQKEAVNPYREIDSVVAVNPDVLQKLVAKTGPLEVQGVTFTKDNIVEKLQYEVEYAFAQKGVAVADRKDIIEPLFKELLRKLSPYVITDLKGLLQLFEVTAREKHIQIYSRDAELQAIIEGLHWDGNLREAKKDYLLWVDANLGALKTDHAMWRHLSYSIQNSDQGYLSKVTMDYQHNGTYDWRTSRYRTFARAFVPRGAVLKEVTINGEVVAFSDVLSGEELGKTWFGTFVSIEPGQRKTVSMSYYLPHQVAQSIYAGEYELYAQKQAGTNDIGLTLHLDFDKTLVSAVPPELQHKWGDDSYDIETDLREDRSFSVNIK